jgi:hypothetical protein
MRRVFAPSELESEKLTERTYSHCFARHKIIRFQRTQGLMVHKGNLEPPLLARRGQA